MRLLRRIIGYHLGITLLLGIAACTSQHSPDGQTADSLDGIDSPAKVVEARTVSEDYSSIYKSDPVYKRQVSSMLNSISPRSAGEFLNNLFAYESLYEKSVIWAVRARAIYTYRTEGMQDCWTYGRKPLALRSTTQSGAEYLDQLFADVGFTQVDGVETGAFFGSPPEPPEMFKPLPIADLHISVNSISEKSSGNVFCQPLNLENIVPSLAKDTHPFLFGANVGIAFLNEAMEAMQFSALAKGQYIPVPIWGLLRQEFDLLLSHVPASANALHEFKLVLDYSTDNFSMKVEGEKKRVIVSAVLIRHVLLSVVSEDAATLRKIENDMISESADKAASIRDARAYAAQARKRFREIFSLAIAHELAHVYLGKNNRLELDEAKVDCFAVANVYRARGAVPLGLVAWMDSDVAGEAREFWSVEEQALLEAIHARVEKIRSLAASTVLAGTKASPSCS